MTSSLTPLSLPLITESLFNAAKKPTIIRLRWLVITVASYVLLFSDTILLPENFIHAFVLFYILTNTCLFVVDENRFESMRFVTPLVVFDTLALSFSLIVTDQLGSDFYLSYFLVVIMAGFWKDFRYSLTFAVVLTLLYSCLLALAEDWSTSLMLRAPFLLIAAVFYSYFVQVVNNEQELRHKAEGEARCDFLTGLPNRQAYEERITLESERARRYRRPLSILMADIDNFKMINDTLGHEWGDIVLQRIASELSRNLRSSDFVARYGGEEFIVVLPETPLAGACEAAEKLRLAVRENPIQSPKGLLTVTVSFGASSNDMPHLTDHHQMTLDADKALYQAKRTGKDRVETLAAAVPSGSASAAVDQANWQN